MIVLIIMIGFIMAVDVLVLCFLIRKYDREYQKEFDNIYRCFDNLTDNVVSIDKQVSLLERMLDYGKKHNDDAGDIDCVDTNML